MLRSSFWRRTPLPIVLANILLAFVSLVYGKASAYPHLWSGLIFRIATGIFIFGLSILFFLPNTSLASQRRQLDQCCAILVVSQLSLSLFIGLPNRFAIVAVLFLLLIAMLLYTCRGPLAAIYLALVGGFVMFAASIQLHPYTKLGADMLAFISHAIDIYRSGASPYTGDFSKIDANPFLYPPLQWLIYMPAKALNADLRSINFASAVLLVAFVEWRAHNHAPWLRLAVYPVMLCALALPMMYAGQVWPYWLVIATASMLVIDRRWYLAATLFAIAIGIRQTAIIPAFVIFIGMFGYIRTSTWSFATAIAIAVLLLTTIPFIQSAAEWHTLLVSGPAQALAQAHLQGNPNDQLSLSNLLDYAGLGPADSLVEAAFVLIGAFFARMRSKGNAPSLVLYAGLVYLVCVSANPYLHPYYYVAGFLMAFIGLSVRLIERKSSNDSEKQKLCAFGGLCASRK